MPKTDSKKEKAEHTGRPPIVVIMGHIDHGKTTILDWYRKTKVVEQESGGITQHIGAYEVEHHGKKITFIDTPGHEAFSKMRSRGARVADIAVLVVAAEDGVKPQTKEAIKIIRENSLPFVVAINKIDKPEANPERTKQQLAEAEILVESYGGQVPSVEISAKMGKNMDDLLEVLLLISELEQPQETAGENTGVVIEAHLDPKRGITSTLLIRNGTLVQGDVAVIGRSMENIKILEDFLGRPIKEAGASSPVRVIGLSSTPMVGDEFKKFADRKEAEEFVKSLPALEEKKANQPQEGERPVFNIIIKADVMGSKEVLEESFKKMEAETIVINVLKSEVGNINESDVKLALATKLVTIIAFKVKIDATVRDLAERANVRIVQGDVIYEVLDEAKKKMEEMLPPLVTRIPLGKVKVLKIFKREGPKQIVGGRVEEGVIRVSTKAEIKYMKETRGYGTVLQVQREKSQVDEVGKGFECGMQIESRYEINEGDLLEIYQEEVTKRKL